MRDHRFKVGDKVEVEIAGRWYAATVAGCWSVSHYSGRPSLYYTCELASGKERQWQCGDTSAHIRERRNA